jgi:hypothetical protein
MIDQFYVKVHLVITAIEPNRDDSQFLVTKEEKNISFPAKFLSKDKTTKDIASNLLKEYTNITQMWAVILPLGIVDNIDPEKLEISVLYAVYIPGITRTIKENSCWKTYTELYSLPEVSEFTRKLAYESIWRQI